MSDGLNQNEKKFLLELARRTLEHYLRTGTRLELKPGDVPSKRLTEDGACFVTLHMGEQLRGCIGSLEAIQPLVFDVVENALRAAFGDPRFYPLTPEEFKQVRISISVLTRPEQFPAKDAEDLLNRLVVGKHGLIIKKGVARATFLPVVWELLPQKEVFLCQLCMKAGLEADEWKKTDCIEFFIYEADEFSE